MPKYVAMFKLAQEEIKKKTVKKIRIEPDWKWKKYFTAIYRKTKWKYYSSRNYMSLKTAIFKNQVY